ncbi:VOC family protein [Apilactobacillus xinyiensis]|jgi:catechol 2,3-dioxygenase-like lactoylglutathione lyase family enzyme|uniref:VOC family protein n=1 Tax=Apilactobacillus xinyiensis TaxID=2841032 RepID=A0ABT0I1M5_9LACO|nr:VOC family protein [Apilactobacillus xinyiensis]MCK8624623.1 VOC family protein [Apilactobacillus xinyiensis]MCL0312515.1 VOC family protein [Apilactobacillus xinyiensis]MCL0318519.1 VOC family protein [Apilactobacillus xinyiensis]MCL0330702.1 VOC family protein [Apilactobacillus xinyiensis]
MALNDYFTGLQHVGIPSKDLDVTIDFYKSLGFEQAGLFHNGENRCAFMKFGNLIVETWEGDPVAMKNGAINHISMNCTDVDKAFAAAKEQGLNVLDDEIQSIPSFWDNGIRFFNIQGPNHETIEFCQIVK